MASLAVQWTAPGRLVRANLTWLHPQFHPVRHLPDLVNLGLRDLYHMTVNPDTLLSVVSLLFAVGLLLVAAMQVFSASRRSTALAAFARKQVALCVAGLIVQLVFIPLLWTHVSDDIRFLGRFGLSFLLIVCLNLGMILFYAVLLWRFGQARSGLRNGSKSLPALVCILALAGLVLLFFPQLRAMHIPRFKFHFCHRAQLLADCLVGMDRGNDRPAVHRNLSLFAVREHARCYASDCRSDDYCAALLCRRRRAATLVGGGFSLGLAGLDSGALSLNHLGRVSAT